MGKIPKIRDSHTSFCQITSLLRMRIDMRTNSVGTCLCVYLLVFYTNTYSKGVFICIVIMPGQAKFCFMSVISYYVITLIQPPFREGIVERENRFKKNIYACFLQLVEMCNRKRFG